MDTSLTVAGYACYFNTLDENNDIILPTAFDDFINQLSYNQNNITSVKFLYQHDVTRPIGRWDIIQPDSVGLYVEGILQTNLIDGLSAGIMTQNHIINGLSIGYKPLSSYRDSQGRRILEAITLYEISLVTFPMQKNAYLQAY